MISTVRPPFAPPAFNTTGPTTPPATPTTPPATPTTPARPPVGPAQPSAPRALPANPKAMGRDEFLKLLVSQLKNQDPLNPMDGKDMAAQLAQFSSVEQLLQINKSLEAQATRDAEIVDAITTLGEAQESRADELAQLIEGQMAMGTVGKIGVTPGNTAFVDRDGLGPLVVDTGTRVGTGRVTVTNSKGEVVGTRNVEITKAGQQAFDLGELFTDPKLPAGKYSYTFEVAATGGPFQAVKTFTAGRITGMKYENGNPILIIGDSLTVPMSQLTQIRA
ncbi:MAG: flagellar hook assembly protein FlgD [Gemmatimonas sp.]|uniref:flagellar hook assembly protein FlgD n=1 Tax=Gemmatimonas sp. TaxID=1962908 RepID=UPI00391F9C29